MSYALSIPILSAVPVDDILLSLWDTHVIYSLQAPEIPDPFSPKDIFYYSGVPSMLRLPCLTWRSATKHLLHGIYCPVLLQLPRWH